jgi:hypothetical protein
MKHLFNNLFFTLVFTIAFTLSAFSQSRSVIDADYFKSDDNLPPLKVGKGFDITDPFRQTNFCFTPESASKNNLVRQQQGQKSNITMYYTSSEAEYNSLKSTGTSGKVSYLNLFSVSASRMNEITNQSYSQVERLIFVANVDFGIFEYENDLVLTPEAKLKVDNNSEFISLYGSHYITGIRKGSSVWVIISKSSNKSSSSETDNLKIDLGAKVPSIGSSGNLQLTDNSKAESFLSDEGLSVSVEINGPALQKKDLGPQINNILSGGTAAEKLNGITLMIKGAVEELSDPEQGLITQYYFAPFTLKGVKNINWDFNKENQLVKLNENVFKIYTAKNNIKKLTESNSLQILLGEYDKIMDKSFPDYEKYRSELQNTYNALLPLLNQIKLEINTIYSDLEINYKKCSNLSCDPELDCCQSTDIENRVTVVLDKIDKSVSQLNKVYEDALVGALNSAFDQLLGNFDCEKNNTGIVTIVNKSAYQYTIYSNGKYLLTLNGNDVIKVEVGIGTTQFKAEQKEGYAFYPTVNSRSVTCNNKCEEATITIGYED